MGYWNTTQWSSYVSSNTKFEQNSPEPQNPNFFNFQLKDFRINNNSVARDAGTVLPDIIVKDVFGKTDNITKQDFLGNPRSLTTPSIGAYEYNSGSNSVPVSKISVFVVSPNPARDFIKITLNTNIAARYTIQLYNLQGKMVYEK